MANVKRQLIEKTGTDTTDVIYLETTASQVIEETDKKFMTDSERTKLSGIASGANTVVTGTKPTDTTKIYALVPTAIENQYTLQEVTVPTNYLTDAQKGVANGIATLDSSGLIPSSQLPSYVDDVIEGYYLSDNKFHVGSAVTTDEIVPETGKIYVSLTNQRTYRWTGSGYIEIKNSLDYSTQEEAEAGLENTKVMTALRVLQALTHYMSGVPLGYTEAGVASTLLSSSDTISDIINKLNKRFDGYVSTNRTINNKDLSSNVTLSASDVSAVPTTRKVNDKALSGDVTLTATDVGAEPALATDKLAGTYSAITINNKGIVTSGGQSIEIGTTGQTAPSSTLAVGGIFFKEQ